MEQTEILKDIVSMARAIQSYTHRMHEGRTQKKEFSAQERLALQEMHYELTKIIQDHNI